MLTENVRIGFFSARLSACLEQLQNVTGEAHPEHVMVAAILENNFDPDRAINSLLGESGKIDGMKDTLPFNPTLCYSLDSSMTIELERHRKWVDRY
jgi:hypothetical protein